MKITRTTTPNRHSLRSIVIPANAGIHGEGPGTRSNSHRWWRPRQPAWGTRTPFNSVPRPRNLWTPALLPLLLLMMTVLFSACSSEPDTIAVRGRSIEIHAERPVIIDKFSYSYNDEGDIGHRVVRPRASNRQLAAVLVTVVNRTSTVMPLLVDPDAAELGDRRGERIEALDPFERFSEVEVADLEEDRFAPLLWGDIQLDRNFQVAGWVIFDVPKGLTLGTLWWNEVDEVVADYIQYVRR